MSNGRCQTASQMGRRVREACDAVVGDACRCSQSAEGAEGTGAGVIGWRCRGRKERSGGVGAGGAGGAGGARAASYSGQ
jgi:hypothetical protein